MIFTVHSITDMRATEPDPSDIAFSVHGTRRDVALRSDSAGSIDLSFFEQDGGSSSDFGRWKIGDAYDVSFTKVDGLKKAGA